MNTHTLFVALETDKWTDGQFVRWRAANFLSLGTFSKWKILDNWMRNNVHSAYCSWFYSCFACSSCSCSFSLSLEKQLILKSLWIWMHGFNDVHSVTVLEWNTENQENHAAKLNQTIKWMGAFDNRVLIKWSPAL